MKKIFTILVVCFAIGFANAQNATFPWSDGFENGIGEWTINSTDTVTWELYSSSTGAYEGTYAFSCEYDANLVAQDEKLISPAFDFSSISGDTILLKFWFSMSYYWSVDPNPNYKVVVLASTDGGANFGATPIWDNQQIGVYENFVYTEATIDISTLAGQSNVKFAFNYLGTDGAQALIDLVSIEVKEAEVPNSIEETNAQKVSIYPNPVNDVLNVNAAGFDKVEIVNFLGQVVYSNQVTATDFQINTADLTAGVYFVRLSGDNTVTKKFVKE
jgi:hypothetical protein